MSNKVFITGNVANEIELKSTNDGTAVTTFNVAVRRPRKKDVTDFFTVVCWQNNAEFVSRYFSKGSGIEVTGVLTQRSYTDKNGSKRYAVEIQAEEIDFGKSTKVASTETTATATTPKNNPYTEPAQGYQEIGMDDELPF